MSESPTTDRTSGWLALFGVVATLALVFAFSAVVLANDDEAGTAGGDSGPVHVALSEFAIEPASITVPEGGALHVQNDGAAAHNLVIVDQDLATSDIPGGASEELDVSSLPVGTYEVLCQIPGHADSGMTGTLEVVAGGTGGGAEAASGEPAMEGMDHGAGDMMTEADYQRMSDAMDDTIYAFPAETEGVGNVDLEPTILPDGTKHFEITAAITDWEVAPGEVVQAWTYNGMVPGPQMHVEVGDRVEVELINELPAATDLHIHGVKLPNAMDGVAPITQDRIEPGERFTYAFTAREPAVAMYHAHHMGQMTVPNGLLGMFYIGDVPLPAGQTIGTVEVPDDLEISQEIPMVLNDAGVIGYSLNGKSFPATEPIVANRGDWIQITYANEGTQIHPMHLHQFDQIVIAKDGYPLDHPYVVDTLNVAPGERYTVIAQLAEPGTWVWHCHILPHVEREEGMFGMVTAVVVE